MSAREMHIKSLTPDRWPDFVGLMQSDSQCNECWCLNHREPTGCPTGDAAKSRMQNIVRDREAHGLLAYEGSTCVGWLAIDSMATLKGHDCQATGKDGEWSIHCLFVKAGFRGKGISTAMIHAAIKYAYEQGAKIISAFPIPEINRLRFPEHEAEFSGRFSTFSKSGFRVHGEPGEFYQRMELEAQATATDSDSI